MSADKAYFVLAHSEARRRAMAAVANAPQGWRITIEPPRRSLDQNSLLWPLLQRFAEQALWPVNGAMVQMDADDWKDVLTAAFRQETQRIAMGLNGGMVILGMRTSKMSKAQFSEFIEFIQSVAADRGVELERESV